MKDAWVLIALAAAVLLLGRRGGMRAPVYGIPGGNLPVPIYGPWGGAYDPHTGNPLATRYPMRVGGEVIE